MSIILIQNQTIYFYITFLIDKLSLNNAMRWQWKAMVVHILDNVSSSKIFEIFSIKFFLEIWYHLFISISLYIFFFIIVNKTWIKNVKKIKYGKYMTLDPRIQIKNRLSCLYYFFVIYRSKIAILYLYAKYMQKKCLKLNLQLFIFKIIYLSFKYTLFLLLKN